MSNSIPNSSSIVATSVTLATESQPSVFETPARAMESAGSEGKTAAKHRTRRLRVSSMRCLQNPVEGLGCVLRELIPGKGATTGEGLAEYRGEEFADRSIFRSRLKIEFNFFDVEPVKQLFDTAMFDAPAECPAAHYPGVDQNLRF